MASLSTEKTSCVHFCRKRFLHPDPDIRLSSTPIMVSNTVKFLGIVFDSKLTFLPDVVALRKRCETGINLLRLLSNTAWGADRSSLLWIYRAIVCSKLNYGSIVYGSARKTVLRRLDTVHHMGLRISCGAFRTSPVNNLYAYCNELPLCLIRRRLCLSFYFKILSNPSHPLRDFLLDFTFDRLFAHRKYCISTFTLRARHIIQNTPLQRVNVLTGSNCLTPPWIDNRMKYMNPFAGFSKAFTSSFIYQEVF